MARREVQDKKQKKRGALSPETVTAIYGVISIVLSLFFVLSYAGIGGIVGKYTLLGGEYLFGVGYLVLPLSLLLLGIALIKSIKHSYNTFHVIGMLVFLGAALGLIHLYAPNTGGVTGRLIGTPLLKFFDIFASTAFLTAALFVALMLLFDGRLNIPFSRIFFWRSDSDENAEDDELALSAQKKSKKELQEQNQAEIDKARIERERAYRLAAAKNEEDDGEQNEESGSVQNQNQIQAQAQAQANAKNQELRVREMQQGSMKDEIPSFSIATGKPYYPPPISLLQADKGRPEVGDVKANANIIRLTLQNFGITVEMDEVSIGPSVTRYALKPAQGVRLNRIVQLQNDLSLALAAHPLRVEAPIPGKSLVGIEIPNRVKTMVGLGSLLSDTGFTGSDKPLMMALGRGISGHAQFANLAKAPHLLIAGATGSGKSVTIHALIASLLYRNGPEQLKMILIDPKRVELTLYNNIPHLLTPVITDPKKAIMALKWAAKEMDRRYNVLQERKVRDIDSYHKNILVPELDRIKKQKAEKGAEKDATTETVETMPYIVVVIDELADIMQTYPRELEAGIVRLAQMSRAVGIHLILSTQRPSVNVITGLIKANVPSRIALQVASQIDSRTILDQAGAEKLLGAGDMLFMSGDMSKPSRVQSAFISETELKKMTEYLITHYEGQGGLPIDMSPEAVMDKNSTFEASLEDEGQDDLFYDAKQLVINTQSASVSFLQRKLGIGFSRAGKLIDTLERTGVIGPGRGAKPREVLMKPGEEGASGAGAGAGVGAGVASAAASVAIGTLNTPSTDDDTEDDDLSSISDDEDNTD